MTWGRPVPGQRRQEGDGLPSPAYCSCLHGAPHSSSSKETVERFRFFEVLEWHAHGEELAIFPALESVAPSELLPKLHVRERDLIGAALTAAERRTLLRLLAKVQGAAAANSTTPAPHGAVRRRRS